MKTLVAILSLTFSIVFVGLFLFPKVLLGMAISGPVALLIGDVTSNLNPVKNIVKAVTK